MKISIKVKTRARENSVEKIDPHTSKAGEGAGLENFVVKVKELPIEGRANEAVIKTLAEYFGVASWRVKIIGGLTSKNKIVEIV